jgi:hypothetical protein
MLPLFLIEHRGDHLVRNARALQGKEVVRRDREFAGLRRDHFDHDVLGESAFDELYHVVISEGKVGRESGESGTDETAPNFLRKRPIARPQSPILQNDNRGASRRESISRWRKKITRAHPIKKQ